MAGRGELRFLMRAAPNTPWATAPEKWPYSTSMR